MVQSDVSRTVMVTSPTARMFTVGLSLYVTSFPSGAVKLKQELTVYGWKQSCFLLTSLPDHLAAGVMFYEGSKWDARYVLDGRAYGFRSGILKILRSPCPLMMLEYPAQIEAVSIRKHRRLKTYLMGEAYAGGNGGADGSEAKPIVVCDLSGGGALIRGEEAMKKGQIVQLSFVLPNGEKLIRIRCEIRNCRKEHSYYFIGVGFSSAGNPEVSKLLTFFESLEV